LNILTIQPKTFTLPLNNTHSPQDRLYWTPEGDVRDTTVNLTANEGAILLKSPPPTSPTSIIVYDFQNQEPSFWKFPTGDQNTVVTTDGGSNYYLRAVPGTTITFHDAPIQLIRSLTIYDTICFKIRNASLNSAVLLRVEVDDTHAEHPYMVMVVKPTGGTYVKGTTDIPHGQYRIPPPTTANHTASVQYMADTATWQTITVDLSQELAGTRYTPKRIPSMRLIGMAELDNIVIYR
jgi:hypothetical protein